MSWLRFFRRRDWDKERTCELRAYLEIETDRNIALGMSEGKARSAAHRKLGNVTQVREEIYRMNTLGFLETCWQDLRYGARTLRKTPGFTLAAMATLALGIGANTAIFQLIDAVRFRTLPVRDPYALARIQLLNGNPGWGVSHHPDNLSYALFEQIREHQQAFSGIFSWDIDVARIGQGAHTRDADVLMASGEFFTTLQLRPAAGRLFRSEDDLPGCTAPGAVLSYPFWQSQFAGQQSAIGARIVIQDQAFEIIGVAPLGFFGPEVGRRFDVALPMCAYTLHQTDQTPFIRRDYFWLNVMGRLKPEWTLIRASKYMQSISPGLMQATLPDGHARSSLDEYMQFRLEAVSGASGVSRLGESYDAALWLLLAVTGMILLIACANLGNLVLARAGFRQREFAVRTALGAGRGRLVRQSFCESLLLAITGAVLGLYFSTVLSHGIIRFFRSENKLWLVDLSLDWNMLAFTSAVAAAACILFGLAPAVRNSIIQAPSAIRSGGRNVTRDRDQSGFQRLLVIVQISVSLVLVTGALLFGESFRRLISVDPGFREQGILTADFDMSRLNLPTEAILALQRQLLDRVKATPQVEAAASTSNFLIGGGMWSLGVQTGAANDSSRFTWVSPGYFGVLDTPILEGRDFIAADSRTSPKVAVVNQTFARRFFPGTDPIGRAFSTVAEPNYPQAEYEVVGLIKDTKYFDLREPAPPMAYAPAAQYPPMGPYTLMYIRSSAPLSAVESALRGGVGRWQPAIGMEFRVFRQQIADGLIRERLLAVLSGFFGILAVLLACVGLYGVMSYQVMRRRNEIGIRIALGASRFQLGRMILREAGILLALGLMAGTAIALAVSRLAGSLLFGVKAYDLSTLTVAITSLAIVGAAASCLPAQRAARLDPIVALREE